MLMVLINMLMVLQMNTRQSLLSKNVELTGSIAIDTFNSAYGTGFLPEF